MDTEALISTAQIWSTIKHGFGHGTWICFSNLLIVLALRSFFSVLTRVHSHTHTRKRNHDITIMRTQAIPDPLIQSQIRTHVVCIEDSFVNSQEWTISRSVPELRLGILGSLQSGKSALVHRFVYIRD